MRISLSEQADVEYRPAGFGSRCLAYTFDFVIRWTLVIAFILATIFVLDLVNRTGFSFEWISSFISEHRDGGSGSVLLAGAVLMLFFVEWSYPISFEVFNGGVTPGKQLFGLRVVDESGLPVDLRASALRTIMLLVDLLPLVPAVGFMAMAMTKRYQRLGDIVARTMVIYDEEKEQVLSAISAGQQPVQYRVPLYLYNLMEEYVGRAPALFPDVRTKLQGAITELVAVLIPGLRTAGQGPMTKGEIAALAAVCEPIREQYSTASESPNPYGPANV